VPVEYPEAFGQMCTTGLIMLPAFVVISGAVEPLQSPSAYVRISQDTMQEVSRVMPDVIRNAFPQHSITVLGHDFVLSGKGMFATALMARAPEARSRRRGGAL
jgi:hypothetical protein